MKQVFFAPNANLWTSFFEILQSCRIALAQYWKKVRILSSDCNNNIVSENVLDSQEDIIQWYNDFWTLLNDIDNIDQILFLDFFAPWLEILQYLLELKKKHIKLWALLHGWSFLKGDLYKRSWLSKSEEVWLDIFHVIYVPSVHLFNLLPSHRKKKAKVYSRGLDYFKSLSWSSVKNITKSIDVIFPHRLSDDKWIQDFIFIVNALPDVHFAVTNYESLENNKYQTELRQYWNISFLIGENDKTHKKTLESAKIILSCAYQENFWYSIMKGVLSWAIPLLPQREVYPEFFSKKFLYSNVEEAILKITKILSSYQLWRDNNELDLLRKKISQTSFYPLLKDFYEL